MASSALSSVMKLLSALLSIGCLLSLIGALAFAYSKIGPIAAAEQLQEALTARNLSEIEWIIERQDRFLPAVRLVGEQLFSEVEERNRFTNSELQALHSALVAVRRSDFEGFFRFYDHERFPLIRVMETSAFNQLLEQLLFDSGESQLDLKVYLQEQRELARELTSSLASARLALQEPIRQREQAEKFFTLALSELGLVFNLAPAEVVNVALKEETPVPVYQSGLLQYYPLLKGLPTGPQSLDQLRSVLTGARSQLSAADDATLLQEVQAHRDALRVPLLERESLLEQKEAAEQRLLRIRGQIRALQDQLYLLVGRYLQAAMEPAPSELGLKGFQLITTLWNPQEVQKLAGSWVTGKPVSSDL